MENASPNEQCDGVGKPKRQWTPREDEKLIEVLIELSIAGKIRCDNGFKPGTFKEVETKLEQKLPGCGLKAQPHIESRLKLLKTKYGAISDMLNGGSGAFAWNEESKMIISEKKIYEDWCKVNYFFILFAVLLL